MSATIYFKDFTVSELPKKLRLGLALTPPCPGERVQLSLSRDAALVLAAAVDAADAATEARRAANAALDEAQAARVRAAWVYGRATAFALQGVAACLISFVFFAYASIAFGGWLGAMVASP